MTWNSTIPAAIGALANVIDAASADTTRVITRVSIGPISSRDIIVVGYLSEDVPAVDGRFAQEGMAVNPVREQYTVHNRIAVSRGSTDILIAEARAFALLAMVGGVIAVNPTLSGAVMLANLGAYSYTPSQTPRGTFAVIQFDVDVDAYTTV